MFKRREESVSVSVKHVKMKKEISKKDGKGGNNSIQTELALLLAAMSVLSRGHWVLWRPGLLNSSVMGVKERGMDQSGGNSSPGGSFHWMFVLLTHQPQSPQLMPRNNNSSSFP